MPFEWRILSSSLPLGRQKLKKPKCKEERNSCTSTKRRIWNAIRIFFRFFIYFSSSLILFSDSLVKRDTQETQQCVCVGVCCVQEKDDYENFVPHGGNLNRRRRKTRDHGRCSWRKSYRDFRLSLVHLYTCVFLLFVSFVQKKFLLKEIEKEFLPFWPTFSRQNNTAKKGANGHHELPASHIAHDSVGYTIPSLIHFKGYARWLWPKNAIRCRMNETKHSETVIS